MGSRSFSTFALTMLLAAALVTPASAQDEKPTGLERARQASMQALDHANGRMAEARGGELPPGLSNTAKLTGRARAAEAIASALARGNGNGNAYGRGRSLEVLTLLISGDSPAVLESAPAHGENVSAMVRAYNELKRQERDAG